MIPMHREYLAVLLHGECFKKQNQNSERENRTIRRKLEGKLFHEKPNSWFNSIQNGSGRYTNDEKRGDEKNHSPSEA